MIYLNINVGYSFLQIKNTTSDSHTRFLGLLKTTTNHATINPPVFLFKCVLQLIRLGWHNMFCILQCECYRNTSIDSFTSNDFEQHIKL